MARIYLLVEPEENAEVKALGAHRDAGMMSWYLESDQDLEPFAKWLPDAEEDEEDETLGIVSDEAFVASARVPCWNCGVSIEVICIFCESGVASDEPMTDFTVSSIWAMDEGLQAQLKQWPNFHMDSTGEVFANHCAECGMVQDDADLHSEPGQPFFHIPGGEDGDVKLVPLVGTVRMGGDESFEI